MNLKTIGHLSVRQREDTDEVLTPTYAVKPIVKFLNPNLTIWCPFDKPNSKYVRLLKKKGYKVVSSHIDEGKDFFKYKPKKWDIIISNPPFSKKDKILKRCYELGKPFGLLLPITAIGGTKRQKLYRAYGCEILFLGGRIGFYTQNDLSKPKEKAGFECCYITHGILPSKLVYTKVKKKVKHY